MASDAQLPGDDLVQRGIADLRAGRRTAEALLVAAARERLTALGLDVPALDVEHPSHALYEVLALEDEPTAHGRYNALRRRLVSYARAAESASARR